MVWRRLVALVLRISARVLATRYLARLVFVTRLKARLPSEPFRQQQVEPYALKQDLLEERDSLFGSDHIGQGLKRGGAGFVLVHMRI